MSVGICDRCKTVVEPRVSNQWFCKMKEMAAEAFAVVDQGLIPVVPENQRTIYLNWMSNIRDWCISRQLWWGPSHSHLVLRRLQRDDAGARLPASRSLTATPAPPARRKNAPPAAAAN